MKKLILLFSVVAAAAMTGFYAQGRPDAGAISAAGDRQMYRVTRFEGQPITGVSASVGFRVEVNESARTSVRVEIPAEWQDRLICEISPEGVVRLGIDTEGLRNFRGHDLTAVVNLGKVDVMKATTGAKITCNGSFTGGNAEISASTGGMVSGLTLTASGVGRFGQRFAYRSRAGDCRRLDGRFAERCRVRRFGAVVQSGHRGFPLDVAYGTVGRFNLQHGWQHPDFRFDGQPHGQQIPYRRPSRHRQLQSG